MHLIPFSNNSCLFLKELKQAVQDDEKIYPTLREDLARIFVLETSTESVANRGWITVDSTTINRFPSSDSARAPHQAVRATDDVMLKVYNVNGTYTTVKLPILSTVRLSLSCWIKTYIERCIILFFRFLRLSALSRKSKDATRKSYS